MNKKCLPAFSQHPLIDTNQWLVALKACTGILGRLAANLHVLHFGDGESTHLGMLARLNEIAQWNENVIYSQIIKTTYGEERKKGPKLNAKKTGAVAVFPGIPYTKKLKRNSNKTGHMKGATVSQHFCSFFVR